MDVRMYGSINVWMFECLKILDVYWMYERMKVYMYTAWMYVWDSYSNLLNQIVDLGNFREHQNAPKDLRHDEMQSNLQFNQSKAGIDASAHGKEDSRNAFQLPYLTSPKPINFQKPGIGGLHKTSKCPAMQLGAVYLVAAAKQQEKKKQWTCFEWWKQTSKWFKMKILA